MPRGYASTAPSVQWVRAWQLAHQAFCDTGRAILDWLETRGRRWLPEISTLTVIYKKHSIF